MEEVIRKEEKGSFSVGSNKAPRPVPVTELSSEPEKRFSSGDGELDRVLGGGIVPGSLILVGGEPGIGKSTLLLQVSLKLKDRKILYVSGEESGKQLQMRAKRIGTTNAQCYILTETNTQSIFRQLEEMGPDLLIIDSVQTLHTDHIESSAGSISQVRECTAEFQKYAKMTGTPVILIGHITKDGYLAGPKVLEHMVDTVLQFEGERNYGYRILRAVKNRFGPTAELGIYEMADSGMREVLNPSEVLLSQREENVSGITVAAMVEGMRPMLVEVQALVSTAAYGTPQRSATGFDGRRLNMLLAVLEKRIGFRMGMKDVFLNIAGGLRVDDPAIDLAVISAVISSYQDLPVDGKVCFAAEVGLSGEIRAVNRLSQRIMEAQKLGFEKIIISKYGRKGMEKQSHDIEIVAVSNVSEVFGELFG